MGKLISRRTLIKAAIPAGACVAAGLAGMAYFRRGPARPNIVLVIADSMRADQLSRKFDGRSITPVLDSIASQGASFTRAYAGASWTRCSVASLFTGAFTPYHGVTRTATTISSRCDTLAKLLKRHGYRTYGLICNGWIGADVRQSGGKRVPDHSYGFAQGFDRYQLIEAKKDERGQVEAWAPADAMTDVAADLVRSARAPFFLYVHYMDTHYPWVGTEPTPFTGKYSAPGDDVQAALKANRQLVTSSHWVGATSKPSGDVLAEDKRPRLVAVADESVSFVDSQVGRLLDVLAQTGALANCAFIFTSDHGEEYWERGQVGHGQTLFDEVLHVPLLIKAPNISSCAVAEPVSTVGIYETAKYLSGALDTTAPVMAPSLAPYAGAQPLSEPQKLYAQLDMFCELTTLRKLMQPAGREIISRSDAGGVERFHTYDLTSDPAELHPLDAVGAGDLRAQLDAVRKEAIAVGYRMGVDRPASSIDWQVGAERAALGDQVPQAYDPRDREMLEQMKALGYL